MKEMSHKPRMLFGLAVLSVVTLFIEIIGYWSIKQAFSSPMDDYILMKDLTFIHFAIVIAVANIARIIPYTFSSFGVYEIISVFMFHVFGEGYLSGTTVTILDSLLINSLTLVFFILALVVNKSPSILETWRNFFSQSVARSQNLAFETPVPPGNPGESFPEGESDE
jgi:uncharacterized membrane protein YbhN (UPF0104 family)